MTQEAIIALIDHKIFKVEAFLTSDAMTEPNRIANEAIRDALVVLKADILTAEWEF